MGWLHAWFVNVLFVLQRAIIVSVGITFNSTVGRLMLAALCSNSVKPGTVGQLVSLHTTVHVPCGWR